VPDPINRLINQDMPQLIVWLFDRGLSIGELAEMLTLPIEQERATESDFTHV